MGVGLIGSASACAFGSLPVACGVPAPGGPFAAGVAGAFSGSSPPKMPRKKLTIPSSTEGSLCCADTGGEAASATTAQHRIATSLNRIASPYRTHDADDSATCG